MVVEASLERVASGSVVPRAALALLSDERLAARAARGDREAFAVLFGRHHQAVYRYSLAILRNPEDAADVLQTTMLKALQTLVSGREDLAVRPWLFRVAHNEAVSLLRRRGRQVELGEETPAGGGAVEEASETRERLAGLLADLGELPERQRGALVMRELEGLPYERIGETLETSAAAAKQMVHEARGALAEMERGRALACATVTARISERDGRLLRGRALRAHLRGCERCRGFRDSIASRKAVLTSLPALPAEQAASILKGLLGVGGGPGAGTAVAVLSGGAKLGAASLAAKAAAPAAVAVALAVSAGGSAPSASIAAERPALVRPATVATAVPPPVPAAPGHRALRPSGVRPAEPPVAEHAPPPQPVAPQPVALQPAALQPEPAAETTAPAPAGATGSSEPSEQPAASSRGDYQEETVSVGGSTSWAPPSTSTATDSSPGATPSQPSAPSEPAAPSEPVSSSQPAAVPSTPSEPTRQPEQPAAGTASPAVGETSSGVPAGG